MRTYPRGASFRAYDQESRNLDRAFHPSSAPAPADGEAR